MNHQESTNAFDNEVAAIARVLGAKGKPEYRSLNDVVLEIVGADAQHYVVCREKNGEPNKMWLFNMTFLNLNDAVQFTNYLNQSDKINLKNWGEYKGEGSLSKPYFLSPKDRDSERKTHIWHGADTLCKGWQTNSFLKDQYELTSDVHLGKTLICRSCISMMKDYPLKDSITLDNENRIIEVTE